MTDSQPSIGSSGGLYEESWEEDKWDGILSGIDEKEEIEKAYPKPNNVGTGNKHIYNYGDIEVFFPYKAYPSQEQMMEKLIKGAQEGKNCLLESPTGTGKTAALLCGLLAFLEWCQKNQDFGHKIAAKCVETAGSCSCGLVTDSKNTKVTIIKSRRGQHMAKATKIISPPAEAQTIGAEAPNLVAGSEDQGSPSKRNKVDTPSIPTVRIKQMNELCMYCIKKYFKDFRPPKIYYTTRTHTQIAQVVKQLKSTHYSGVKITILSSRNHTCINSKEKRDALQFQLANPENSVQSLNEKCNTLKNNFYKNRKKDQDSKPIHPIKEECEFFAEAPKLLSEFRNLQLQGAWDIEELVEYGQSCKACPYFGSQLMHEEAEIIFCPYNYLICPAIRAASNVMLVNSIVVFDEAHNIEDICRSAASLCIDHDNLDIHARRAFDNILTKPERNSELIAQEIQAIQNFSDILLRLSSWILKIGNTMLQTKDKNRPVHLSFLNTDIVDLFKHIGLGPETLEKHEFLLKILEKSGDEFEIPDGLDNTLEAGSKFQVPSEGLNFVANLLSVLKLMFGKELVRLKDYKVVLVNTLSISLNRTPENHQRTKYLLDIICFNPAVAFEPIKNSVRSIIVASGTLSPMMSFASELETPFEIDLSADHVVTRSQVWAGVVKCGPSSNPLELKKDLQDKIEIQDEIGTMILQICEIIPHGVLVFLPSYNFMNILKARWSEYPRNNPLINQIRKSKIVYFEDSKNNEMFEKNMKDYKENIKAPNSSNRGCILFAVFRGKVSEGIDFPDDQARAVITVGIPYASCFSYDVAGKRAYNDSKLRPTFNTTTNDFNSVSNVLSGSIWYKVQAFRAINQAFGRCIRHQNDWGAIIMIDARLGDSANLDYLSGWVQTHMRLFNDFKKVTGSISDFVERQLVIEEELQSLSEYDGEDTQLCEVYTNKRETRTTQCCRKSVPDPFPVSSCSKFKPPVFDGDSSAYSIEDFDDDNDHIFTDSSMQSAIDKACSLHEQETVQIDNLEESKTESEISYHSETEANTTCSEANTSVDMILGTP